MTLKTASLSTYNSGLSLTDLDTNLADKIAWKTIPGGILGTMQTLETMAILARAGSREPGTAALVAGIVRNSAGTSDMVSAIDNFLRNTFVYRGERDEVLRTVPYMLHDFETL